VWSSITLRYYRAEIFRFYQWQDYSTWAIGTNTVSDELIEQVPTVLALLHAEFGITSLSIKRLHPSSSATGKASVCDSDKHCGNT